MKKKRLTKGYECQGEMDEEALPVNRISKKQRESTQGAPSSLGNLGPHRENEHSRKGRKGPGLAEKSSKGKGNPGPQIVWGGEEARETYHERDGKNKMFRSNVGRARPQAKIQKTTYTVTCKVELPQGKRGEIVSRTGKK